MVHATVRLDDMSAPARISGQTVLINHSVAIVCEGPQHAQLVAAAINWKPECAPGPLLARREEQ